MLMQALVRLRFGAAFVLSTGAGQYCDLNKYNSNRSVFIARRCGRTAVLVRFYVPKTLQVGPKT